MWEPNLTDLQRAFYRSTARLKLAYGARASGKTWGVEHCVMRHAWRNNARIAVITKTTRTGSLGVWPELTGVIFNEWVNAGIASDVADFGWAEKPKQDNITKIHTASVYNRLGGKSQFVLFPIEHPGDALEKLLSTQWSYVWISEGHLYKDSKDAKARDIFDTALGQLRLAGVPWEETGIVVDTNPPDSGTKHWLYDIFFRERVMSEWPDYFTAETIAAFRQRQEQMEVHRFPIESNTFLHPGLRAQIIAQYAHDRFAYRRFVNSEWIDGIVIGVFSGIFSRNRHVVGSCDHKDRAEWEVIPPVDTQEVVLEGGLPLLLCGWDIGDVNHAWVCAQPVYIDQEIGFRVLEEHVITRGTTSTEDFTAIVLEKMDRIERSAGFKIEWRHFSDSSAFEFRSAISRKDLPIDADMTDAAIVESASGGRIELEGSAEVKKPGWQRRRVNFMAQLMREDRFVISAQCTAVIEMCSSLRKAATTGSKTFLDPEQDAKHPFDALSYLVSMFCLDEMLVGDGPTVPGTEKIGALSAA